MSFIRSAISELTINIKNNLTRIYCNNIVDTFDYTFNNNNIIVFVIDDFVIFIKKISEYSCLSWNNKTGQSKIITINTFNKNTVNKYQIVFMRDNDQFKNNNYFYRFMKMFYFMLNTKYNKWIFVLI